MNATFTIASNVLTVSGSAMTTACAYQLMVRELVAGTGAAAVEFLNGRAVVVTGEYGAIVASQAEYKTAWSRAVDMVAWGN